MIDRQTNQKLLQETIYLILWLSAWVLTCIYCIFNVIVYTPTLGSSRTCPQKMFLVYGDVKLIFKLSKNLISVFLMLLSLE